MFLHLTSLSVGKKCLLPAVGLWSSQVSAGNSRLLASCEGEPTSLGSSSFTSYLEISGVKTHFSKDVLTFNYTQPPL